MLEAAVIFLGIGVLSGVMAGLLGIGGGLIIVPLLGYFFKYIHIDTSVIMHLAVGTSLAAVAITAVSSTRAHHKKGTVKWEIWKRLIPGLIAGSVVGSLIAEKLDTSTLTNFFAGFELLVALYLAVGKTPQADPTEPNTLVILGATFLIGVICAFAGVGGGIMIVPFLVWQGLTMKEAVSTSAAAGLPIALTGSIGFAFTGLTHTDSLPELTLGFIYLPAFIGIGVASILSAPSGAKLAHALPNSVLKKVFSIFLVGISIVMFLE
ncbi:MAG: sulfite exporter TauE/SafE family protein [Gammaproteobacteria bacterium]|nr:sulfite exporter TauE/SafE family protein [Gammaproteobacteria bacterium]